MSSSARTAFGLPTLTSLNGAAYALLLVAALGAGFLWSSGHDDQRIAELALLAILGGCMLARRDLADQIAGLGRPARLALGVFFTLGAISALNAWSPVHALYEWSMLLFLLLAAALIAAGLAQAGAGSLAAVLPWLGIACLLYAVRTVLVYATALATGYQIDMHGLAPGFANMRFFNHTQTALLPLIVLLYLQAPQRSAWRRTWFALAAFWWALLIMSEARASMLALGVGCAAVFAVRRAHARSFLKAMALSALAGAVLYVIGFILLPILAGLAPYSSATNVLERTAADPTSRRNLLWQLCIELIAAHPWLGVGPHHFAHEGATLSWGAHPHNFMFQVAAEWGLPALLCLLGAIGIGLRGLVRRGAGIAPADLGNQQTLAVLLAGGVAILVDGLFSGVIVMPQSQMAIVLYLGCAAGWARSLDGAAAPRGTAPGRWLSTGLAAAALCGLIVAVGPNLIAHALHEPPTAAEKAVNPAMHWPRLWSLGYF